MIVKLCLLLFADDAAIFAETPCALQSMLHDLHYYILRVMGSKS